MGRVYRPPINTYLSIKPSLFNTLLHFRVATKGRLVAQGLMITLAPEQLIIAAMRDYVVNHCCRCLPPLLGAECTIGVEAKEGSAEQLPAPAVTASG